MGCFDIEVTHQDHEIVISQRKHILELLQRVGLSDAKRVSSPMTSNANLALGDISKFDNMVKYRQLVGSLQYITLSRMNNTFAVNKVY